MSLKGNLSSVNLTEIFQMLSLSGREGTLFIYEGARKRAICFTKEGVSIRSRERNESNLLGKILVRLAKVDEADLDRAVEERRSSNRLLGDVLVDAGGCTREDVDLAFRIQSEEDIQDLFLNRSDAQFEYVDGYFPETDVPFVNLNVNSLLIEIARRTDEWEYIRRRIRGPREIYRFTGSEGALEADILAECYSHRIDGFIDGTHSVGEIIELSYVNKFEVCKLLAAYLDAGVIELVPADAIRQNARVALRTGDTGGAIRHYEYLMSTGDFPLDVMGEAAEAHEANRDFAEAAALLRRLGEEMVRAGDDRGAIESLRRVATYPRPEPEALRYLLELVFESPRAAAEFSANIIEAGKTLVAHYLKQDQRHEALGLLERLVKTYPDEVAFAVSMVSIYYEDGNAEKAATEAERLGNAFLKRKRHSPAVSLYKKLLVIDPERHDIRERIRKIVSGKRRRSSPGAFSRVLVAICVALLLGSAAVVILRSEGPEGTPGGIPTSTLAELWGRAEDERGTAEEHGARAKEEYMRLLDEIGEDPLANKETLLSRKRVADKRFQLFTEKAEAAMQIADTIRKQTAQAEASARARAMITSLEELDANVRAVRGQWLARAQRAAETLRSTHNENYTEGKLQLALDGYQLARTLATRGDWIHESDVERRIANLRNDVERVERLRKRSQLLEEDKDYAAARRVLLELVRDYGKSDLVEDIRLPVEILTVPPGAGILLDKVELPQRTPAIVRLSPYQATTVSLRKATFEEEAFALGPFHEDTDPNKYQYTWTLRKAATWVRPISGRIESAPVAWKNRVAACERNGRWVVLEAESGREVAKNELKDVFDGVQAGLATDGRHFFVPALDGMLFAFDAVTCRSRYTVKGFEAGLYATPAVADGIIYLVDNAGNVSAWDVSNGTPQAPLWRLATAQRVRAAPVVQGDDVVVVSVSGEVTVISRSKGEKVVGYPLKKGPFVAAPALAGKDDLVFGSEEGILYGVERLTGDVRWTFDLKRPLRGSPIVRGRAVFASTRPGELISIDTKTGDVLFRYNSSSDSARGTVAANSRIFFANGRILSAFAPRPDGHGLAWTFEAKGRILAGPVVSGGAVYIGDELGNLYRLEAND